MVFNINIQRITNISQSFRFSFCFPHISNHLSPGEVAWYYRDYPTVEKTKTGGKKRGGKVKMEWSFRGKGRQDGDMN